MEEDETSSDQDRPEGLIKSSLSSHLTYLDHPLRLTIALRTNACRSQSKMSRIVNVGGDCHNCFIQDLLARDIRCGQPESGACEGANEASTNGGVKPGTCVSELGDPAEATVNFTRVIFKPNAFSLTFCKYLTSNTAFALFESQTNP